MINKDIIKKIKNEYDTPLFLFDADELRNRAWEIKKLLNKTEDKIGLCYSIKANPFLIPYLIDIVDKFEVCSPGELQICKQYNVDPSMIIYSGVHKEKEDIEDAISFGAGILTAESVRHYEYIKEVCNCIDRKVSLILRLSSKSQFGMSIDDIRHIINVNKEDNHINVDGIHYFVGTQRTKLKHQRDELLMLKETIGDLREETGLNLPLLEYGPGLAYPYFVQDDFQDTLNPLKELLPDLIATSGSSNLTVEMGRFLASSCGYYFSDIRDVKESYDTRWVILDGGINHLNYLGQMMGMKIPIIITVKNNGILTINNSDKSLINNGYKIAEKCEKNQTLCGSLCTTNDVIARNFQGGLLSVGDTLIFCNIGAYSITEGLNLFLSRNMPLVLICSDGIISKVRDVKEIWKLNC
ncbi:MAG: diaminopimelate decarboxylase [Lachnospiraceae bacterium]|nr:diaminopimelate decarboxylase [Lachnospiraceae bacterium]